jgi:hypothetical protein
MPYDPQNPNYQPDFIPLSDSYGKLKSHDYFKSKEVIEINPPKEMSIKDFRVLLSNSPEKVGLATKILIKYPSVEEKSLPLRFFPYRNVILDGLDNKNSYY